MYERNSQVMFGDLKWTILLKLLLLPSTSKYTSSSTNTSLGEYYITIDAYRFRRWGSTELWDCYEKMVRMGQYTGSVHTIMDQINTVICRYLLSYHNTPQTSTNLLPAELLYKRKLCLIYYHWKSVEKP